MLRVAGAGCYSPQLVRVIGWFVVFLLCAGWWSAAWGVNTKSQGVFFSRTTDGHDPSSEYASVENNVKGSNLAGRGGDVRLVKLIETMVRVFTGPIAYTFVLLGFVIGGVGLVFNPELPDFAKKMLSLMVVGSSVLFASQVLSYFFGYRVMAVTL